MTHYSRGQHAQIAKRLRLRGVHDFSFRDRKCIVCGHGFNGPACQHTVAENQEVLKKFSSEVDNKS